MRRERAQSLFRRINPLVVVSAHTHAPPKGRRVSRDYGPGGASFAIGGDGARWGGPGDDRDEFIRRRRIIHSRASEGYAYEPAGVMSVLIKHRVHYELLRSMLYIIYTYIYLYALCV